MQSALLLLVLVLVTTAAATETCENGLDGQVDSLLSADVTEAERLAAIASAVRVMLAAVGEDPAREGLVKTPSRVAKALLANTAGYDHVRRLRTPASAARSPPATHAAPAPG